MPCPTPARLAFTLGVVLWLFAGTAEAQVPVGPEGLPGGAHVASPRPAEVPGAALASVAYAYTESVLGSADTHQRAAGTLGVGYALRRWLGLGIALEGRSDFHSAPRDRGLATSTRLATRHAFDVHERLALGLAALVRFPGADGVARGLSATSPQLLALAGYAPTRSTALSISAGYRLDRSRHALDDPFELSPPDRLAAELQAYDALPVGALFALRAGSTNLSLEWSWDVGVGSGAPAALESPMRIALAAQATLGRRLLVGCFAGASPSARPELDRLVRVEPRLWAGLSLGVAFGSPQAATAAERPVAAAPGASPPRRVRVALRVVDASGAPIAGARVSFDIDGAVRGSTADEAGRTSVDGVEGETLDVLVEAKDFAPRTVRVDLGAMPLATGAEQLVTLASTLPEGEIKGKVRSLRGGPLVARIEVVERGESVMSQPDGNFRLTVPPGSYTLRITADRHETQQRSVRVEQLGVAILVIDLRRLAP
jgi:hypothetical protein